MKRVGSMRRNLKRKVSLLLAICLLIALFPAMAMTADAATYSGTCGPSARWSLDTGTGVLSITGSGKMYDYEDDWMENPAPWIDYADYITSVEVGNEITYIGRKTFGWEYSYARMPNLKHVSIGSGVKEIADYAFINSYLTEITIPASVQTIGEYAFVNCTDMKEFIVEEGNPSYSALAGVLFNKRKTELLIYPAAKESLLYTVPSTAKTIADWAFENADKLVSVSLPEGMTELGLGVFWGCYSLKQVNLPSTLLTLNVDAFMGCEKLHVIVPQSVATLDAYYYSEGYPGATYYFQGAAPSLTEIARKVQPFTNLTVHYVPSRAGWSKLIQSDWGADVSWKTWDGVNLPNSAPVISTGNYYDPTATRLFRIMGRGAEYGSYPKGFVVTVGEDEYTSDSTSGTVPTDDVTALVPSNYYGSITISHEDYHSFTLSKSMTGNYNVLSLVPKTVTEPFAQALLLDRSQGSYTSYRDLLTESDTLYEVNLLDKKEESYDLYTYINWNGHGKGTIWLEQGEQAVSLREGWNLLEWSELHFEVGKPVYLCAEAADGATMRTQTKLKVSRRLNSGVSMDLGGSLEVDTSQSSEGAMEILSNESLKLDFSKWSDDVIPMELTVKPDGTVEGVFGITLADASYKEAVFGTVKERLKGWQDLSAAARNRDAAKLISEMKKYGAPVSKSSAIGLSGNVQVLGYLTGNLLDGKLRITEMECALLFEGAVSYTHNTVIMSVPAYFKAQLKASVEALLKMKYDEELEKLVSTGKQHLEAALNLSMEAGPGWEGFLSGGVRGSGTVKMKSFIPIAKADTSFSLQADIAFVGTLAGVSGTWVLGKTTEKVFWDGGKFCWKDTGEVQTLSFVPDLMLSAMQPGEEDSGDIVVGVNGYSAPELLMLSDGRLLAVWVADVDDRSAVDKNGVYYSLRDTNGTWSDPALVCDDGTNDSLPQLHQSGSTIYLAWQNYTTVFAADTLPDYETISAQLKVVTATFNAGTGSWSAPRNNEPSWYMAETELPEDYEDEWPATSSRRQVLETDSHRIVVYTAPDEQEVEQVFALFHDGNGWGQPVQLTKTADGVGMFGAAAGEETVSVLYTHGELNGAALALYEHSLGIDLAVTEADYLAETLVPGRELTMTVDVANSGAVAVDGMVLRILDGETVLYQEAFVDGLLPGEETLVYISCTLPDPMDFNSLTVEVLPLPDDGSDCAEENNRTECIFRHTDLSVEYVSAVRSGTSTQVMVQIVNRGLTAAAGAGLTFRKNSPDGEILGESQVPELEPGDAVHIDALFPALNRGDMVYVAVEELPDENLVGNNSSQAVVAQAEASELQISAQAACSHGVLTLTVSVDNRTVRAVSDMVLLVAAYDKTSGRLLDAAALDSVDLSALNSFSQDVELLTGSAADVVWKIYVTGSDYVPRQEPVTGSV